MLLGLYALLLARAGDITPGKLQVWHEAAAAGPSLLPSQIFVPRTSAPAHPILVFLHGGGDGPFNVMNQQSLPWLLLNNQTFAASFPFLVILPCSTCSGDSRGWTAANYPKIERLVSLAISQHRGDAARVSLTGQSMGGGGLWHYAGKGLFAALVPVCAAIHPSRTLASEACCKSGSRSCCAPVWAFHGANDRVVPVAFSDQWVEVLRAQPHRSADRSEVRYTRYPHAPPPPMAQFAHLIGHGSYELAYRDMALYAWLLQQRCDECRPNSTAATLLRRGDV